MTTPADNEALREEVRKQMRAYYNHTFEYAIAQLQKGDISAVLANPEETQKELDKPYLDEIMQLFTNFRKQTASDIFNLAHQYAREDKTMIGSENLRAYHYYNALAKIGDFDGR